MIDSRVVVIGGTSGIGRDPDRLASAAAAGFDTAAMDAHDGDAIEASFRSVGPVDHVVSLVAVDGGVMLAS